jgi:hypothetical protein
MGLAQRIAKQREWRQTTIPGLQYLALRYEATQCGQEDILAGNDDPSLPLVTCDKDHKQAYLLAPSIISGDQIENASSGMDQRSGGYVVDLQFKSGAANTWADFTAAHIGTQTAFTLDSEVVSAPQIREAIPGGRTQITGGDPPFTSNTAKQLANVLKYGSLYNCPGYPYSSVTSVSRQSRRTGWDWLWIKSGTLALRSPWMPRRTRLPTHNTRRSTAPRTPTNKKRCSQRILHSCSKMPSAT